MPRPLILFAFATLIPVPLIAAAAVWGGVWGLGAVLVMTVFALLLDEAVARVTLALPDTEFPVATGLSVVLALSHFALLILAVAGLAGAWLGPWEKVAVFAAAGLYFGQVSNSNAHELIHRRSRGLHDLGMWVYISLLFGHHTSAHVLVHHRFVATRADPSSARRGEGFYRFAVRAWQGSFRDGLEAERARLRKIGRSKWRNPYLLYLGGAVVFVTGTWGVEGPQGLVAYLALAVFAQSQLLMSDYVQHYGLSRSIGPGGKPEQVAARHSWNSPHWFSSALMLNAPRHSDHHAHPARPYPSLSLPDDGPMLPRSLPVMACLALIPSRWRQVMDPLADVWAGTPGLTQR